jgi:hypothetical protein
MIKLGQMFRISVIVSMSLLAACDVGSVLAQIGGDGGGSGDDGGGSDCPALVSPEPDNGNHVANGAPGAGSNATVLTPHEGCMGQAGCHNGALSPGAGGAYDYGGEAFQDGLGTIPYAGATILLGTVSPAPAQYQKLQVAQNGFFYLASGTGFPSPDTQPIQAWICVGTNKVEMTGTLGAGNGNCTTSVCHGPTPAPDGFIYTAPAT